MNYLQFLDGLPTVIQSDFKCNTKTGPPELDNVVELHHRNLKVCLPIVYNTMLFVLLLSLHGEVDINANKLWNHVKRELSVSSCMPHHLEPKISLRGLQSCKTSLGCLTFKFCSILITVNSDTKPQICKQLIRFLLLSSQIPSVIVPGLLHASLSRLIHLFKTVAFV